MATVTPADVSRFTEDGAICVRHLFDSDQIELIRQIIGRMLDDPGPHAKTASRPGEPAFLEDFCRWQRHPELLEVIHSSGVAEVAGRVMESSRVRFYHDHVLVKEPGSRQRTPWHQNQPFYNIDGNQNVSVWIPVDAVERSATLEFVAGSHAGAWYLPTTFLDGEARWFPRGTLSEVPDMDANRDNHRILGWELEPGDVVFFHMLCLHGSAGNDTPTPRRVLSLRFLGDDITHAPRPWATSPPFPGLEEELTAGGPMDHPLFPVVWEAEPDAVTR